MLRKRFIYLPRTAIGWAMTVSAALHICLGTAYLIATSSHTPPQDVNVKTVRVSLGQKAANAGQAPKPPTEAVTEKSKAKPKPEAVLQPKPLPTSKPVARPQPTQKQTSSLETRRVVETSTQDTQESDTSIAPVDQVDQLAPLSPLIGAQSDGSHDTKAKVETGTGQSIGSPKEQAAFDAAVRKHLRRYKRYPSMAKRKHMEGSVSARFEINRAGELVSCYILTESGSRYLDKAALDQIKRAATYPTAPKQSGWKNRKYTVKIDYSLTDS